MIMEVVRAQKYVPYLTFSPTLEPEDDLELKFLLNETDEVPSNPCDTPPVIINCTEAGIDGVVTDATLIWKICGQRQFIEAEPQDIEVVNSKTMSITFVVEDIYQNTINDFEVSVIIDSTIEQIISRGRIFL